MQDKLPRSLAGQARQSLEGEPIVAGALIQTDPAKPLVTAVVVTPTRLLHVDRKTTRGWPLTEVGVTDYQPWATGQLAALSVLAGGELWRFVVPRGEQPLDLQQVFRELRGQHHEAVTAAIAELPWWERKAAWPYAVLGRVAGGDTPLVQGQHGSLGLGRRGVSIYLGKDAAPSFQIPWQDVTELFVERPEELQERVPADHLLLLGVLAWGLETTEGQTFVSVMAKGLEFYFGVQAPVTELRGFWGSVLSHFTLDPEEVAVARLPAATAPRPAPAGESSMVGRLERLAALHASGALTAEEYTAAKAAIIQGR